MPEFLTYFLSHMPSRDEWVAFLLVNIVAYLAARNSVLRRERRTEKKTYSEQIARLEAERIRHSQFLQEQEQLVKEHRAMIQQQANQLDKLNQHLYALRQLHLN
jgi:hypothetical protein